MKQVIERVEVIEKVMHEAEAVCPACRTSLRKSVDHSNGQETLKCSECGQMVMKDPVTGSWATNNCIERSSRGSYSENPEGDTGRQLEVKEYRLTESYLWRCENCNSQNKAEFHRSDFSSYFIPAGTLKDENRNLIKVAILKCPACQEMIGYEDGTWSLFKAGNPKMVSKPILRQNIAIQPEIRQYLSWVCGCGDENRIELDGKEEPQNILKCHSCKNTATKIRGKFVMIHPRQR